MKKRFLAVFLALALCMGLAVPAFALDKNFAPHYKVTSSGDSTETKDFTLRHVLADLNGSFQYTYIRSSETKTYTNEIDNLPLGSKISITGLNPGDSKDHDIVELYAWSDPDGDGIYDQQVYVIGGDAPTLPLTEKGPFTSNDEIKYYTDIPVSGDGTLDWADSDNPPTSITLTADYLTEVFGADTLLEVAIYTIGYHYDAEEDIDTYGTKGHRFYHYYLTGEKAAPTFTDVPDWCSEPVSWAAANGITTGTGNNKFSPGDDCTHVQILTFLWRAENRLDSAATAFDHLAGDYAPAANWAYEKGLIGNSFDPGAPCTRAQAVSYIWQALGKKDAQASSFPDVDAGADYAKAVDWAVENGIVEGYTDGTFGPDTVCNRGVIATMLHRAYVEEARLK